MKFSRELVLIAVFTVFMLLLSSGTGEPRITGAALATGMLGSGLLAILVLVGIIDWVLG